MGKGAQKGWDLSRIIVATMLAALTFAFAARAGVTNAGRGALWKVVQTCVANHALTGAAFPCLKVDLSAGAERGYVVLRPPLMKPDIILTPTRKIVGVEDPSLQALGAPNYFEDAWNARAFLTKAHRKPLGRADVALAVNSRVTRSQDQLHIHIGCLASRAKRKLQALAPQLPDNGWVRIGGPVGLGAPPHSPGFWGRRVDQETLAGVNPFRLAAEEPALSAGRSRLMIVAAGIELADGRGGFVLLAAHNDPAGPDDQLSAEDFLDASCS
jgi:CDP-diacylglycerol pyrophosphatase